MNEKKWTDDERDEAFDRGMETMQRVALELYRRGREPLLEELEEARARNADMRAMLEQVTRERDEARTSCPDCAMWAERSARWHDDMQRAERERDKWRDKFHALNQTAGELCETCGWAFKLPGEQCRCEVVKERDDARAEVERLRVELIRAGSRECDIAACNCGTWHHQNPRAAYRRGAEAMREACARWMSEREGIAQWVYDDALSALPIPEEP